MTRPKSACMSSNGNTIRSCLTIAAAFLLIRPRLRCRPWPNRQLGAIAIAESSLMAWHAACTLPCATCSYDASTHPLLGAIGSTCVSDAGLSEACMTSDAKALPLFVIWRAPPDASMASEYHRRFLESSESHEHKRKFFERARANDPANPVRQSQQFESGSRAFSSRLRWISC